MSERPRIPLIAEHETTSAMLNQEVILFRCLLSHEISIPMYSVIFDSFPRDNGVGHELPWRPHSIVVDSHPNREQIDVYRKLRQRFYNMEKTKDWVTAAASMRRFALAWENPFPADALADIVAALEGLVVHDKQEVSYKLRVRTAHLLAKSVSKRRTIYKDLQDAYAYRSTIAHGGYVFDTWTDWTTAKSLKGAKGKQGNPFHDVNEIHRLKFQLSKYYRQALSKMICSRTMTIDWSDMAL